jgi:hypothetical protein
MLDQLLELLLALPQYRDLLVRGAQFMLQRLDLLLQGLVLYRLDTMLRVFALLDIDEGITSFSYCFV